MDASRACEDPHDRRMTRARSNLVDPFGRPVDDLRVSLTPACDLRCWFCHHEGNRPNGRLMTPHELRVILRTAAHLGIRYTKLTGGEPLLRPDLEDIVRHAAALMEEVSLVTNGQRLEARAASLRAAGLRRVNVSLHTVDPDQYRRLTGGDIDPVLRGIRAAVAVGLHPVKVNVVATRDTLERIDDLILWADSMGCNVQIIEMHTPPGVSARALAERVPLDDVERALATKATAVTHHRLHARKRFHLGCQRIETTRPQENASFCASCTRLRLTHDGYLKPCLMRADNHLDILGRLRAGATIEEMEALFRQATSRRAPFWTAPVPMPAPLLPIPTEP